MSKIAGIFLFLIASSLGAQDYPYDEKAPPAEGSKTSSPQSLLRFAIKGGIQYAFFQQSGFPTQNALGPEAYVSVGWDLRYQPFFIELQTGYRGYFVLSSYNPLHMIPLSVSLLYRHRSGTRSLLKFGIQSSLDLRIAQDTSTLNYGFSVVPSMSLIFVAELWDFLIEPFVTFHRIQSGNTFLSTGLRTGLRF